MPSTRTPSVSSARLPSSRVETSCSLVFPSPFLRRDHRPPHGLPESQPDQEQTHANPPVLRSTQAGNAPTAAMSREFLSSRALPHTTEGDAAAAAPPPQTPQPLTAPSSLWSRAHPPEAASQRLPVKTGAEGRLRRARTWQPKAPSAAVGRESLGARDFPSFGCGAGWVVFCGYHIALRPHRQLWGVRH